MPPLDQPLDQPDDFRDRLAGQRFRVGTTEAEPIGVCDVGVGHLTRQLRAGDAELMCRGVDLVVDIRNICHENRRIPLMDEKPLEQQEDDVRPGVAYVDPAVHGGAAGVDADLPTFPRRERAHISGARVVQTDFLQGGRTLTTQGGSAWASV